MLRYIIGITLITIGIIIVRALSNGKVLEKHQYAFWIVIPVFMMLSPFIKFSVPVNIDWNNLFPTKAEIITDETASNVSPAVIVADGHHNTNEYNGQTTDHTADNGQIVINTHEQAEDYYVPSDIKTKKPVSTETLLTYISYSVSAALIVALLAYNTGFILYCRRKREYAGKGPGSGLKIYRIKNKGTPFLLFNKIYVDKDSGEINEYVICHEACHYKHGDYIWVLIRYLVLFLNWYNPVIWVAFVLSGRDSELACDEEVLHICGADSSAGYVETLLGLLRKRAELPFSFSVTTGMRDGYKTMKKRIISIKKPAQKSRKVLALSLAVILLFTSCSFADTSNKGRKVAANSTWFTSYVYDVDIGSDHDRELEDNDFTVDLVGVDEKLIVVRTRGQYEGTMDQKNVNWNDYTFDLVSIIDRNTKEVVNTIDVQSALDELAGEYVVKPTYSQGVITIKTSQKETDYDPLTANVLDTRPVTMDAFYRFPEYSFSFNEYVIEVRGDDDNHNHGYDLRIISPDGEVTTAELKENGTNINSIKMLPLNETKVLFITHGSKGYIYFELDLTESKVSKADAKDYEWIDLNKVGTSITGNDGKVYCITDNSVLKVDSGSKTTEEIFNYNWCGTNTAKLKRFKLVDCSEDALLLIGQAYSIGMLTESQNRLQIIELTKADTNPNAGKTILELYSPYVGEEICAAIEKYNETNEKCFIEISERYNEKDYNATEGDWRNYSSTEMAVHTLNANSALGNDLIMDIVAGTGPDILIGMSRYSQFNNPDYLVDLSPYVSGLDSETHFTNIIEGSKTNGVLYQLPVSFYVRGIYTDREYAGVSGVGFTFDEYKDFMDKTLNGNDLITSGQAIYFTELFNSMDDRFIKDGKADFTGPEFAQMAEYVKENVFENGRSKSQVSQDTSNVARYDEYQSYHQFYMQKSRARDLNDPTILGIPSMDGRGPMFTSSCSVAVSAHAVDIDACVDFVKLLLSDEIQTRIAERGMGFVLNRNAFRAAGDGAIKFCNNRDDDFSANKVKLTKDDINNLERILLSCSNMINADSEINIILIEEMPAYFLGQKDLDAVIKIAQDRAQKVLDERG